MTDKSTKNLTMSMHCEKLGSFRKKIHIGSVRKQHAGEELLINWLKIPAQRLNASAEIDRTPVPY